MEFILGYPLLVTLVFLVGTILYYFMVELRLKPVDKTDVTEGISFIIPCYNEEETVEATIQSIEQLSYPLKEIIAVNDGSSDGTAAKLYELQQKYNFTFIDLEENRGKANALNTATKHSQYDYIMVVDADTIIDEDAPYYMMENFRDYEDIGAVTGNPRIRNKDSLISRIQVLEYASIIGCIKRAQTMNGIVNTVSGVFTLYSKQALEDCGYWDIDMITEDIAVSWKMHLKDYKVIYDPRALCRMLVPETLGGLWKQRIRWAQGGQEVLFRDFFKVIKKGNLPYIFLAIEQIVTLVWAMMVMTNITLLVLGTNFLDVYFYAFQFNLIVLSSFILIFANIIFFVIALLIDSRYEPKNIVFIFYLAWYPLFYWMINAVVSVFALPRSLSHKKGEYATWTSPDRGIDQ